MKSSEIEKEQEREMANSGAIDTFGVNLGGSVTQMSELICVTLALRGIRRFERRLLQKPNTTAKLALPLLRLSNRTKFTITKSRSRFVAVSRCSILTPAGLQVSSAKPDVPGREPASSHRK